MGNLPRTALWGVPPVKSPSRQLALETLGRRNGGKGTRSPLVGSLAGSVPTNALAIVYGVPHGGIVADKLPQAACGKASSPVIPRVFPRASSATTTGTPTASSRPARRPA